MKCFHKAASHSVFSPGRWDYCIQHTAQPTGLCVTAQPPVRASLQRAPAGLLPGGITPLGKAVAVCLPAGSASLAVVSPSQSASFPGTFRIEIKERFSLLRVVAAIGFDYWEPPPERVPVYGGRVYIAKKDILPGEK